VEIINVFSTSLYTKVTKIKKTKEKLKIILFQLFHVQVLFSLYVQVEFYVGLVADLNLYVKKVYIMTILGFASCCFAITTILCTNI
jgi:hypothetical protein